MILTYLRQPCALARHSPAPTPQSQGLGQGVSTSSEQHQSLAQQQSVTEAFILG